jgi:glucose-1-phosphate thymidylyltransferase
VIGPGATIGNNVTINHGTAIGPNVTIGANTVLKTSIVFADTTIDPGSIVTDAILGQNVTLGSGTVIEGGDASIHLNGRSYEKVTFGGIIGDNATVGANVSVLPGTRLGNNTTVASGCRLEGEIPPETRVECR